MQVTFKQFQSALTIAHAAHVKHNNLECFLFNKVRSIIVAYVSKTPNWKLHVTIKQGEDTIPACRHLQKMLA